MHRIIRAVACGLVGALAIAAASWLASIVAIRSHNPRALAALKRWNRHENRFWLHFAGRSATFGTVHHLGRKSGREYRTPVSAYRSADTVVIPLPYGRDVDWLRNLQAAGAGVVDLANESLQVEEPAVQDISGVLPMLPPALRRRIRLTGARQAVRLRVTGVLLQSAA